MSMESFLANELEAREAAEAEAEARLEPTATSVADLIADCICDTPGGYYAHATANSNFPDDGNPRTAMLIVEIDGVQFEITVREPVQ